MEVEHAVVTPPMIEQLCVVGVSDASTGRVGVLNIPIVTAIPDIRALFIKDTSACVKVVEIVDRDWIRTVGRLLVDEQESRVVTGANDAVSSEVVVHKQFVVVLIDASAASVATDVPI